MLSILEYGVKAIKGVRADLDFIAMRRTECLSAQGHLRDV
jgi:hypothetical protein